MNTASRLMGTVPISLRGRYEEFLPARHLKPIRPGGEVALEEHRTVPIGEVEHPARDCVNEKGMVAGSRRSR